ncbi:hypothetical protein GCM10007298_16170 [Williamsia phyllosphaerae]|uniref:Uncharacterized protein n=1 Tax=Williamsia phyllosphaerae TaxID=885042 RepID=A0ABQ1UMH6_9NOCA|nr:hypothetical protein GCM10007298_16170 [Williamsia phyllosphaerae]
MYVPTNAAVNFTPGLRDNDFSTDMLSPNDDVQLSTPIIHPETYRHNAGPLFARSVGAGREQRRSRAIGLCVIGRNRIRGQRIRAAIS